MADKNWQAGSKNLIPAQPVVCLVAIALAPCGARGRPRLRRFCAGKLFQLARSSIMVWELVIGGIVGPLSSA